jgi:RNA polymerase sigma factor (sigma-70 family)
MPRTFEPKNMNTGKHSSPNLADAVASAMARHGQKWLRFVLGMVRNQADAEDVLQEAVQRVLTRGRPLPDEDQARMYLSRAICNIAIETYHRKKRERRKHVPLKEEMLPVCNRMNPQSYLEKMEDSVEKRYLIGLLNQGLSRLPLKHYEAVRLTIMESEMTSIREAVALNGIPYSTLRHRSAQGVHQLRKFLHRALRTSAHKLVMV